MIALTATATPKVLDDIQKNLGMTDAVIFKSSFNRPNLYYEIRPKDNATREILRYIRENAGKSGIIYCLSRKKVEQMAVVLGVNGVKVLPYHAGMDAATRTRNQDAFLHEEVDVIVATIAFGMGIDKPDVRFVIHYDMPKSLEGYYQETGRAGRDGGEGHCIAFYSKQDVNRLERFMQGKSVPEQEIGRQLLQDTIHYAQGGDCRRLMLLHYFGEEYTQKNCGACDNCLNPRPRFEGQGYLSTMLKLLKEIGEGFRGEHLVNILMGSESADTKLYEHFKLPEYGSGKAEGETFWDSIVRQAIVLGYIRKDIQRYGLLFITEKGEDFLRSPHSIQLVRDHDYETEESQDSARAVPEPGGGIDSPLFQMLKNLRTDEAKRLKVPPFVIFQDTVLQEMTIHYPLTVEELQYLGGVSLGKAKRYGKPFVELIKRYVEEQEIERPNDLVVKVGPNKSQQKVALIQCIDRKMDFEDIAEMRRIEMDELLKEVESLVASGLRLDISYFVDQVVPEDVQEEVYDYFRNEAQSDSLEEAMAALKGLDIEENELRLVRIKFLSEMGN